MCVKEIQLVTDRLVLADPEWIRSEFKGEAGLWLSEKVIVPTVRHEFVKCTCGMSYMAEIESYLAGNETRYRSWCPETGACRELAPEECVGYTFDASRMVEILSTLFQCRGEATEILPSKLWKMCRAGVPIAGRCRDIYFAPRMSNDAATIFAQLPEASTPILIVGHSRFVKNPTAENTFDDLRIVPLDVILMIKDNGWEIDLDWLNSLLADLPAEPKENKGKGSRADTVATLEKALKNHLQSAYSYYCDGITKGLGKRLLPAPTFEWLGQQVGRDRSVVSKIIASQKDVTKCKYKEVHLLWMATQDVDLMVQYGKSQFGSKRKSV